MIINAPDPDPGRCLNYRNGSIGQGGVGNPRRCLLYEGHEGRCRFPAEEPVTNEAGWGQTQVYKPSKPKPWVSPLDADA
jgi:hypothetical protein